MTQELEYYEYNGNKYHRDKYGNWFVKPNGLYESLFIESIKDEGLKSEAINELQGSSGNKAMFTYEGMDLTIWIDQNDTTKSKIDRKTTQAKQTGTYDNTVETKAEANKPATVDKAAFYKSNKGGNSGSGDYKKSKRFYDIEYVTFKEFLEKRAKNSFIDFYEKANPNVFLVKRNDIDMEELMCIIARTQWE